MKFHVGQRVRPSAYGIDRCIFPKTRQQQSGVVVRVDRFDCPTIKWQGRKTNQSYFFGFIAPDRRRKCFT